MKTVTGEEFYTLPEGTVFRGRHWHRDDAWMIKGPDVVTLDRGREILAHPVNNLNIPATPSDMDDHCVIMFEDVIDVMEPQEIHKVRRFWTAIGKINALPLVVPIGTPEPPKYQHIDELLDDYYSITKDAGLRYAYWFFFLARLPAAERSVIGPFIQDIKLFVDYEGRPYRVTGASRLGDIFLTTNFNQDTGYEKRIAPDLSKLSGWRPTPRLEP